VAAQTFAVPTAVIVEGGTVPGDASVTIDAITGIAANDIGGFGYLVNDADSDARLYTQTGIGALPTLVLEEDIVLPDGTVNGVESSFGVDNSLNTLASPTIDGDDTIYRNTQIIAAEGKDSVVPGNLWTFGSGPDLAASGLGHFVGGFGPATSSEGRGVFQVDAAGNVKSLIVTGDLVGNTGGLVAGSSIPGFGGGLSRDGTFYAYEIQLDASSTADGTVIVNDDAFLAGSTIMREGTPVDAAVGGLTGEVWDNFDAVKINEAGTLLVTGDTNGASADADEFLFLGDSIVLREGDTVSGQTVDGSISWAALNESDDYALTWSIDNPAGGSDLEVLIVNGEIILTEGDVVDFNGDGILDATDGTLVDFTGLRTLEIGERTDGFVDVYFTADIDFDGTTTSSDDLEGFFIASVAIPEPATAGVLGLAGLAMLRRRRA
jgi:hypothetical protein